MIMSAPKIPAPIPPPPPPNPATPASSSIQESGAIAQEAAAMAAGTGFGNTLASGPEGAAPPSVAKQALGRG